jgi:hypothetical protein
MGDVPEDGGDDRVEAESGRVSVVLAPDVSARVNAIVRSVEGVVEGDDDRQQPGQDGEDLVDSDGASAVAFPLAEGVVCMGNSGQCMV